MSSARRYVERLIARRLIADALTAGYFVTVNNSEEDEIVRSKDAAAIFSAMCSTDEDYLFLHTSNVGRPGQAHGWIKLVYGNDGPDLISDYSTNLEPLIKPIYDWINATIDTTKWDVPAGELAPVWGLAWSRNSDSPRALRWYYIARMVHVDGVWWELYRRNDVRQTNNLADMKAAAKAAGLELAGQFMPAPAPRRVGEMVKA